MGLLAYVIAQHEYRLPNQQTDLHGSVLQHEIAPYSSGRLYTSHL